MGRIRSSAIVILGGFVLVLGEVAVAKFVPPIGSIFFLITIAFLEAIEGHGIPTLQGSPDGWPIPTQLGWYYAAALWWVFWSAVLALALLWRSYRASRAHT